MHSSILTASPVLRRTLVALFLTASLGAQTTPAAAPAAAPPAAAAPSTSLFAVAEAQYEHDFSAGIKNTGSGELNVDHFGLGVKASQDWDQNHLVSELGYTFVHYDFTGVQAPFSSVNKIGGSVLYTRDIDAQWGAFGYLGAMIAADSTTNFFDGSQIAFAAGPTYKFSEDLNVDIGPMIYTRLEDSATWTAFAEAHWKFAPQWELHAYAGASNGVTVAYDIFNNHATVADATVEYNSHWFEVSSVAGGSRSVNETETVLKLGVRQMLNESCFVRGYVSMLLSREYQFHIAGNSANSFDVNDTLGLGIEIGTAF